MTAMTQFWAQVDRHGPDECWPWMGTKAARGYGWVYCDGRSRPAHRIAYEQMVGPIPDGLVIDHLCRNRACINPAHMEPVTNRENILRGISPQAINARKTACVRGHELAPGNTYADPDGSRECRTCRRARARVNTAAYKQRQREAARA